jgi:molybdopterin-guanine dinucleotide biosynthesis protein A
MGLAVVILAGGRATRMGGGDKPLKVLRGVPILSHVLARVARHGRGLVLNANGDASRFAPFGLPVVAVPLSSSICFFVSVSITRCP